MRGFCSRAAQSGQCPTKTGSRWCSIPGSPGPPPFLPPLMAGKKCFLAWSELQLSQAWFYFSQAVRTPCKISTSPHNIPCVCWKVQLMGAATPCCADPPTLDPIYSPSPLGWMKAHQKHHCCAVEGVDVLGVTAGAQGSKDASRWRRTLGSTLLSFDCSSCPTLFL